MAMEVLSPQHHVHTTTQSLPPTRPQPRQQQQQSQQLNAPTSQESILSVYSSDSSNAYSLQTSTSDLSQLTALTELSSSAASNGSITKPSIPTESMQQRARTPDNDYALTSPMSITSPTFSNAAKRTASGHIKNAASLTSTAPYMTQPSPGRTRAESISSTGSRVGDLAASLKMRLGYAMTKVQHGWEHKNLSELERLTSKPPAPVRPSTAISYAYLKDYQPVDAGIMSPPSKRRSGMFGTTAVVQEINAPRLQPPADIYSPRHGHTRSADLRSLPLTTTGSGLAMSPPQTPVAPLPRRPPTIRTDTQTAEAERDALQALTQLGSPHNSQYSRHYNVSQNNSSQASPLRTEFNTNKRRVSFARGNSDSSVLDTSSDDGAIIRPAER